jgi:transposase-like protein
MPRSDHPLVELTVPDMRIRPYLQITNGSWRVDETYIQVKGQWVYLYRAVDAAGQTIDFLLSAKRDEAAARQALAIISVISTCTGFTICH